MSTLTRRSLLLGAAAGAATLAAPAPVLTAHAAEYATAVLAPHQDDEVLRLSGYITHMTDRGDSIALVTATDGAATSVGPRLGLTPREVTRIRDAEQEAAWHALTDGRGPVPVRLGLPDGGAEPGAIYRAVRRALEAMQGRPELYVSTYPPEGPFAYLPSATGGDAHPDHVACVAAARMLAADGVTVRYAIHPSRIDATGTATYDTTGPQMTRVTRAVAAYREIGQRSVPAQFDAVLAARGRSVVSR